MTLYGLRWLADAVVGGGGAGCGGVNGDGCCGYCYGLDGGVTGFKMLFISIILMFHMQKWRMRCRVYFYVMY